MDTIEILNELERELEGGYSRGDLTMLRDSVKAKNEELVRQAQRIARLEGELQYFVDRVEAGTIRSHRTYTRYKQALSDSAYHYNICSLCEGTGLQLNVNGEPDMCTGCKGNTVVGVYAGEKELK